MENWGLILKRIMEGERMDQVELAANSGLLQPHLSRIQMGHYKDPKDATIRKLAKGLKTSEGLLRKLLRGEVEYKPGMFTMSPILPAGKPEDWAKHASPRQPLLINVYSDYVKAHAGEPVDVVDQIFVDMPETAPESIKSYRIEGDCMEPYLHHGEYAIVNHDAPIENGDRVVAICEGKLHVAKLKIIGSEYWLENRTGTMKMTDCQGIAKVVGHYGR